MENMEESIYIRIIKYGLKHPGGFSADEIIGGKELNLKDWEVELVSNYIEKAFKNETFYIGSGYPNAETLFLCIKRAGSVTDKDTKYVINLDAHFKYIEYVELREAREVARKAQRLAWIAIIISSVSVIAAIIVALLVTQTVKLEIGQLNQLMDCASQVIENKK